jgi:hypothetical protein
MVVAFLAGAVLIATIFVATVLVLLVVFVFHNSTPFL